MTNLKRRIISAAAAGVMALNVVTPALATEIVIDGNGANSDNYVTVNNTNTTSVTQNNTANVTNTVKTDADTGDNKANYNTGGNVGIQTGDAEVKANVSNTLNSNQAQVNCCAAAGTDVKISGNGAKSDNTVKLGNTNLNSVTQNNNAKVTNDVDADAETGDNDANFNTGGDVVIMTGDAKAKVDVDNSVNFNAADIDCGCEFDVLAKIAGNGAEADNHHHGWFKKWWDKDQNVITLDLVNTQLVGQTNGANLNNDVDVDDAETGDNEASSNTGAVDHASDPAIVTGDAYAETNVSNSGNMNVLGNLPFNMPEMPQVDFSFNMAFLWAMFGMSL